MTISKRVWVASWVGFAVVLLTSWLKLTSPIVTWYSLHRPRLVGFGSTDPHPSKGQDPFSNRVVQALVPSSFGLIESLLPMRPHRVQAEEFEIRTLSDPIALPEHCQPIAPHSGYQIRFKGLVVALTLTLAQAEILQQQLIATLNAPQFDPAQIQPMMQAGMPAISLGESFTLSTDVALMQEWPCHPELLTIDWMNHLRQGLQQRPLGLAEAQEKLHALQATNQTVSGMASWYGNDFHGLITATGEPYNQEAFTAAHPSLPFDTFLRVTNLRNGHSVVVRVNDRGPYYGDRSLDMSRAAARSLESERVGVVPFEATILQSTVDSSPSPDSAPL